MKNYQACIQNSIIVVICVFVALLLIIAGGNPARSAAARQAFAATTAPPVSPTPVPPATITASPTAPPVTATSPAPTPAPTTMLLREADIQIYETVLTLPTYPFREYLIEQVDPRYNMPVYYFNRPEYEAAAPEPAPVTYTAVVLENPYLRLSFLPELGGRLYSAVIKATGQELFYHNPVVKPSRYGGLTPAEANWWLATGGMEWAYPTQEHGYRFGVPWDYTVAHQDDAAVITLSDTAPNRVGLTVTVSLPANQAAFTVAPTLVNATANPVPVQLWTNAALALTGGSMSPLTRFVIPTEVITIHSRGEADWRVPPDRTQAPWPVVGATDLSQYWQWANYLGLFVSNQDAPFIGAYNPVTRLGIVRLAGSGPAAASGKLFAFSASFTDRSYTDDESQYFEIWGGANAGFWPDYDLTVAPDDTLSWQEQWWPLAGLRQLTWANETVAIGIRPAGPNTILSALVSRPISGQVQVQTDDGPILNEAFTASPNSPLEWKFTTAPPLTISFTDNQDTPLLLYQID